MGKYLVKVLLVFIFLTCAIWYGLPLLKDHAPEAYNPLMRYFLTDAKIEKLFAHVFMKTKQALNVVTPTNAFSNTPFADRMGNDFSTAEDALIGTENDQPKKRSSQRSTAAVEPKAVQEDPLSALNTDPGYDWGIVVTNSFIYDAEMKRVGIFSGGTVVSRKQSLLKKHGYVSECFYLKERKWEPQPFFIYESDLVMFDSTYEAADGEQRNLLIKYCRTLAEYEEKRTETYKKAVRMNPHFDTYKKAIDEYNAFFKKVNAAKDKLPKSAGMDRTKLMDELRKYRAEESLIVKHFKETKERYTAWKTEHLEGDQQSKMLKTIEIQNLENALQAMRPRVHRIVPGL